MIIINFFTTLRSYLQTRQVRIQTEEMSVLELLLHCEMQTSKPFTHKLLDDDGNILPDTMILVNGQNVRHLQGIHTIVRNGADVALFPPGGYKEKARS
jgi:molybdopterin synthase sulfur carrier subunit